MIGVAIARLDAAIRAAGIPIDGVSGSQGSVRVDYQAAATGPQRTNGATIVASFDWSAAADATYAAQRYKADATTAIDYGSLQRGTKEDRLIVGLALVVLDEVNVHSTFEAALLAAFAAATSLANLQVRVAAVTPVPQRTTADLVAAVKAKIAATGE